MYIGGKQGVEGPKASNARSAGNVPRAPFACWDHIPNPETQNSPALQPGCFSAARPVGRLSFAASAAVGGGLFAGEEALCQLAPDAVCLLRRDLAGLE